MEIKLQKLAYVCLKYQFIINELIFNQYYYFLLLCYLFSSKHLSQTDY